MSYTNSSLVTYKYLSPNHSGLRKHNIDTITIHCIVGQISVQTLGSIFAPVERQASSNYGIGYEGRVGMYVEERNRSWCSSSSENDNRAVTIEVASDTFSPYHVRDDVYEVLIKLVADICKRNGIKKLVWSDKKEDRIGHKKGCNMTVHRDFANTDCPGDYLYGKMSDIAKRVNALLSSDSDDKKKLQKNDFKPYTVKVLADVLNIRKGAGTNYKTVGTIKKGEVYTIVQTKKGDGSVKGWGRLKSGAGWISLDWVTKYSK